MVGWNFETRKATGRYNQWCMRSSFARGLESLQLMSVSADTLITQGHQLPPSRIISLYTLLSGWQIQQMYLEVAFDFLLDLRIFLLNLRMNGSYWKLIIITIIIVCVQQMSCVRSVLCILETFSVQH